MSVIAHTIYVCEWPDCNRMSLGPGNCPGTMHGYPKPLVPVEYVPADQPQGAVGAIAAFVSAWDAADEPATKAELDALHDAVEALRAHGGQ